MWRFLKAFLAAIAAAAVVAGLVVFGAIEGWGRPYLSPKGQTDEFAAAIADRLDKEAKGNAAFIHVEQGRPVSEHFVTRGLPVDRDTQFQVASLSKWTTAWGVMTLVDQGKLDLDAPVSTYLKRWRLPPSPFDNNKVTVRRLLSHTAGLTDGLGYGGFPPGKPLQSLEDSLTRASDASPGADGAVRVGIEPGSKFLYSGGGYTLLQLVIEEVSGMGFNDYMTTAVFKPLGMTRSTYILADPQSNVAEFYDEAGAQAIHYRFTSLAPTSLYTSAGDMARFIAAQSTGPNGEPVGRGVLRPETVAAMRKPHASQMGADIWGLGVVLYAPNNKGDFTVGHDGQNDPAVNTTVRLDPATGDGFVLLETGNKNLATVLGGEWVYWNTGEVDNFAIITEIKGTLVRAATGAGLAFVMIFSLVWWLAGRRRVRAADLLSPG